MKLIANDLDRTLGAYLKKCRVTSDKSIGDIARLLGVTYQQVQKYEKGENRISASFFLKILEDTGHLRSTEFKRMLNPEYDPKQDFKNRVPEAYVKLYTKLDEYTQQLTELQQKTAKVIDSYPNTGLDTYDILNMINAGLQALFSGFIEKELLDTKVKRFEIEQYRYSHEVL